MEAKTYKIDLNVIVEQAVGGAKTVEETLANGTPQTPEQAQKKTKDKEKSGNAALLMLNQYTRMGVSKVISNWGDMTGNYVAQENLQVAYNAVDTAITLAINWKVGLAKLAVDTTTSIFGYIKRQKESERTSRFNLYRVGERE